MSPREPLVLILTHSDDHFTVDRVAEALERRGARALRFDTDRFPASLRVSSTRGPGGVAGCRIEVPGVTGCAVDGADVAAVWARRVWKPRLDPSLDERYREGCSRESLAALEGLFDGLGAAHWINPLAAERAARNKLGQLREAEALGLAVPRTLVTNDPERVRAFHDELAGPMVTKMLTPLTTGMQGSSFFVHTSEVSADDLEHLDGLRHCPMVFQELVPKALELRVTCVDDELFIGAVDASASVGGQVDWRAADPREVSWQNAELADDLADRMRSLVRRLGLVYGAIDLIRTPAGEHVFLEINPGGEWGMLERDLDLPISDALARALLEPKPCRP